MNDDEKGENRHSVDDTGEEEDSNIIDLVLPPTQTLAHGHAPQTTQSTTNQPLKSKRTKKICSGCNAWVYINKAYKPHLCVDCCADSSQKCRAHDAKKKFSATKSYMETSLGNAEPHLSLPPCPLSSDPDGKLQMVNSAINEKHSLYMIYLERTHPNQMRQIDPDQVITSNKEEHKEKFWISAHCHLSGSFRNFVSSCIARIEDYDWTKVSPSSPPTSGLF